MKTSIASLATGHIGKLGGKKFIVISDYDGDRSPVSGLTIQFEDGKTQDFSWGRRDGDYENLPVVEVLGSGKLRTEITIEKKI